MPEPEPLTLTARESEVLHLVCLGLTDRQIGAPLFISHRMAERHGSNLWPSSGPSAVPS